MNNRCRVSEETAAYDLEQSRLEDAGEIQRKEIDALAQEVEDGDNYDIWADLPEREKVLLEHIHMHALGNSHEYGTTQERLAHIRLLLLAHIQTWAKERVENGL